MTEFLEYAARGKNEWWRYIVVCIGAIVIAMALMVLGTAALLIAGALQQSTVKNLQHPTDAAGFFLFVAATFGAFMLGLAISAALLQRKSPRDLIGRWSWQTFAAGFGAWLIVQVVATVIDLAFAPHGFSVTASRATLGLAVYAAIGLSVQTFTEEFIFRGYLTQGFLLAFKRPIPASIACGLLFGLLHYANGLPQAVSAGFFGIACSYVAIRTGGIALTAGIHLANNYFGAVTVVSADDVFKGSAGILTYNAPQLMWLDVGFSALAFLALAVLVAHLWPVATRAEPA